LASVNNGELSAAPFIGANNCSVLRAQESGTELPHTDRFNLMVPRSRCPHCGYQITALIVFARRGREKPIPFGPYLAPAGLIALLYGAPISRYAQGLLA
jgi:prepilin signal peptidase PulO-like enzyme (type II secretory pathway)